jgi:hypothetical protein
VEVEEELDDVVVDDDFEVGAAFANVMVTLTFELIRKSIVEMRRVMIDAWRVRGLRLDGDGVV